MVFQQICHDFFCDWWRMFNSFISTCVVAFNTTHRQNKARMFDTECLVPVASLCGVVGSPSWLSKYLISRIGGIWSVVYINTKCMCLSENRVCTIIECEIVRNVRHVTSTWPLIFWWSGAANFSRTTCTERPYRNSLGVNCVPFSVWIPSIYH